MEYYVHGVVGCESIMGTEYCDAAGIDKPTSCPKDEINHAVTVHAFPLF
jgi:hypothetical protein